MADQLLMDATTREILRLWLQGRERVQTIPRFRWNSFLTATTSTISFRELGDIIDVYGARLLDLIVLGRNDGDTFRKSLEGIVGAECGWEIGLPTNE